MGMVVFVDERNGNPLAFQIGIAFFKRNFFPLIPLFITGDNFQSRDIPASAVLPGKVYYSTVGLAGSKGIDKATVLSELVVTLKLHVKDRFRMVLIGGLEDICIIGKKGITQTQNWS